jgi:arginase family enzyme
MEAFHMPSILTDRIRAASLTRVYVHLDVDVLNPDDFPASLMRTPGGPTLKDTIRLLTAIDAAYDMAGFSVVEYCGGGRETRDRLAHALAPWIG